MTDFAVPLKWYERPFPARWDS